MCVYVLVLLKFCIVYEFTQRWSGIFFLLFMTLYVYNFVSECHGKPYIDFACLNSYLPLLSLLFFYVDSRLQ